MKRKVKVKHSVPIGIAQATKTGVRKEVYLQNVPRCAYAVKKRLNGSVQPWLIENLKKENYER